eukprot:883108-Rhodomonas_salina.2
MSVPRIRVSETYLAQYATSVPRIGPVYPLSLPCIVEHAGRVQEYQTIDSSSTVHCIGTIRHASTGHARMRIAPAREQIESDLIRRQRYALANHTARSVPDIA